MTKSPLRRTLGSVAALVIIAGAVSLSAPASRSVASTVTSHHASAQMRILPGPAVVGPIRVPAYVQPRHGFMRPGKKDKILYVSDTQNNRVQIYDPTVPNPSPMGSITTGVDTPAGLAIDKSGTLYVSNLGNNTITEYPAGQTSPSVTITGGLSGNYGVAVDSKGNVFASNLNNNTITGYKPGQNTPFETISLPSQQPVGLTEDTKDNLYIAVDTNNIVYQVASGSMTLVNLNLSGSRDRSALPSERRTNCSFRISRPIRSPCMHPAQRRRHTRLPRV